MWFTGKSIWSSVKKAPKVGSLDIKKMEELFCQNRKSSSNQPAKSQSAKKSSVKEVSVLDSKRNLAVNLFLHHITGGAKAILQFLQDISTSKLGPDELQRLKDLLPQKHEVLLDNFFYLYVQTNLGCKYLKYRRILP